MKKILTLALVCGSVVLTPAARAAASGADPLALYAQIHAALAADSAEGVATAGAQLAAQVRQAAQGAADPAAYEALATAAAELRGDDLAALRQQFKVVSKAFAGYVNASGTEGAQLYFCPMADAYWMQAATDASAANPYYGQSMLKCGSKVDKVGS